MPSVVVPPKLVNAAVATDVIHVLSALGIEYVGARRQDDGERSADIGRQIMVMPPGIIVPQFVDTVARISEDHVPRALTGDNVAARPIGGIGVWLWRSAA